jgi:predicted ATPase
VNRVDFLHGLVEAYSAASRFDDALNTLTKIFAVAQEHEDLYLAPELHRLKGELLLQQDNSNSAEAKVCFQGALEIARTQGAKSSELNATISLAGLFAKQGRRDESRKMLAEIYNWFTEGFDTADLKDAKALLDELIG